MPYPVRYNKDQVTWEQLYRYWIDVLEEYEIPDSFEEPIETPVPKVSEAGDIEGYDWIPKNDLKKRLSFVLNETESWLASQMILKNPTLDTLRFIAQCRHDKEKIAALLIAACSYQIIQTLPVHWRGRSFFILEETNEICWLALKKECGSWSHAAKYIFPEQFYSPRILSTIPVLTYRKIVELAALNYLYYRDTYQIVHYHTESHLEVITSFQTAIANNEPNSFLYSQFDTTSETPSPLVEGSKVVQQSKSYERNSKARRICLRFHGHTCAICGLNFGEKYGAAFNGIVEVHHIEPLSLLKEKHEVDPVNDLIPLCPNCHRMIHAKKDGVYSPDELREMIFGQK